jgi:hypothetical protein
MAEDFRASFNMLLNLLLFSQLRARCISQQCFPDTATFVHLHPPEAV